MSDTVALEKATLEAKAAREQLRRTTEELQARLEPSRLIDEAVTGVREGTTDLAIELSRIPQRKPRASAAVAATVALLLLRKPIARAGRGLGRKLRRKRG